MRRKKLLQEMEAWDAMLREDRLEHLLAKISNDLAQVRSIVVAWWWLLWIGVAIVVTSAIASSA